MLPVVLIWTRIYSIMSGARPITEKQVTSLARPVQFSYEVVQEVVLWAIEVNGTLITRGANAHVAALSNRGTTTQKTSTAREVVNRGVRIALGITLDAQRQKSIASQTAGASVANAENSRPGTIFTGGATFQPIIHLAVKRA